jgi:hypothetical protein
MDDFEVFMILMKKMLGNAFAPNVNALKPWSLMVIVHDYDLKKDFVPKGSGPLRPMLQSDIPLRAKSARKLAKAPNARIVLDLRGKNTTELDRLLTNMTDEPRSDVLERFLWELHERKITHDLSKPPTN